jgi:hypothetical protein
MTATIQQQIDVTRAGGEYQPLRPYVYRRRPAPPLTEPASARPKWPAVSGGATAARLTSSGTR